MDAHWQKIKQLCAAALDLEEPQRGEYLVNACEGDPELRREVDSILRARDAAPPFFETPAGDLAADLLDGADASLLGQQIGEYRVESRIGSGGMGTVYSARRCDGEFEQRVAIKLIRRRILSGEAIRRFRGERQALASLNHPNIARLYGGGVTDAGVPYVVMEHVDGVPIDEYCRREGLAPRGILELFRTVCGAVQHVHQNLIVHRDLKPGNILVDRENVPKLVDFGIAKALQPLAGATDAILTTAGHGRPFTPAFASPEQIRGGPITTASDVYSLGVIRYMLLSGQGPFEAKSDSPYELERRICEDEPSRPSTALRTAAHTTGLRGGKDPATLRRARVLTGDIDAIVMKALRKEPSHRYASVEQLSEDIRRYLSGLPVLARRDTAGYRLAKFCRRHRAAIVGSAAVGAAILGGMLTTIWQARIAVRERDVAMIARQQAQAEAENARVEARKSNRVTGFLQDVLTSADPARLGRDVKLTDVLERAARNVDAESGYDLETQSAVLSAIGNTYFGLGRYDEAELYLTRSLEIQRGIHGGDHADVASRINDLAALLYARGKVSEARTEMEKGVAMQRRLDGEKSVQVAQFLNNLGAIWRGSGDLDRAEALLNEARTMRLELCGADSVDLAETLNNLAYVRMLRGDAAGAIDLNQQVLATRRRRLGARHPLTIQAIDNSAVVFRMAGQPDRAESLLRESLSLHRQLLGNDHPDVAISLANLGRLLVERGEMTEAEPLLREALGIDRQALAPSHSRIARTAAALANSLMDQERFDEAEPLLLEAGEILRNAPDARPGELTNVLAALRNLYIATGRSGDAECIQSELDSTESPQMPDRRGG
ncbi:MAG: serine/threonine protein kinase [Planctomycetes bacterium]|nr:serine/threonine protein kinase [Planctomycetota bacterium]